MEKLRLVLKKIQDCIEMQQGATESQLKAIWNDISDSITEHEQVELKSVVSIPFKCPYMDDSCPFVDTMTAILDKDCRECDNNTNK